MVRACQACRLRKVKCNGDGEKDCAQCTRLGLKCSYPENNPDSRLRRSTVRGSVIQSFLEPDAQGSNVAVAVAREQSPSTVSNAWEKSSKYHDFTVDANFFLNLVHKYSSFVLPTFPVISESNLVAAIGRMKENQDDYALVHAIGAATWCVVSEAMIVPLSHLDQVRSLYTKALTARGHLLSPPHITTDSIMISVFLTKCFADVDGDSKTCYYYLREAITRLQLLRVDDPHSQAQQSPGERQRRERVYWLLFIQERFDALCNFRPAALSPLPHFPEHDPAISSMVNAGFIRLIELFRMVDADFLRFHQDSSGSLITLDWIRRKQAELGNDIQSWEEGISSLSLMQQVDLGVTRYWLRALVWQMSLQMFSMYPEVRAEEDYMSILFPVRLSHNLRSLLADMPREAVEIHSTGILHKIFEITAISADILEHIIARMHDSSQQSDHIDNFVFLSRFLTSMPRFHEKNQLEAIFHRVRTLFPWYFERAGEAGMMK